jgi:hypothetical protein
LFLEATRAGAGTPNDVDVVGRPNGRALRRANARLEERLGVPVQITVVTPEEWDPLGHRK